MNIEQTFLENLTKSIEHCEGRQPSSEDVFAGLRCKRYPDTCYEAPELEARYEHGVCLDCMYIPDVIAGWQYAQHEDERALIYLDRS